MDKKIKSSFTQKASDLCNDTDPVGGKIKQAIPPLLQGRKRRWRRSRFSTMIFLLLNWQLHLAPELDSFSDSPSLYPKGSTNHCCLQPVLTHNTLRLASMTYTTQVCQQHQLCWSSSVRRSAPAQLLPSGSLVSESLLVTLPWQILPLHD